MHYANDRRYMGWGNFFDPRNRSYFGLKFAYETIPNELVPFDYDTFAAYPGTAEAVVTNLPTGRAEYWEVPRRDEHFLLLQATCAMPVLFQPIRLDGGIPYLDGGCADAIPWKRALEVGCDRVVVVLTRERSYRKEPEQMMPLFQLSIGNPGSSFAIEIARKIGLPDEVIRDASEIVGSDYIQSDKYLQDIVRDKRYWENKRQNIHQREKSLEQAIARYENEVKELEQSRKDILRKAKEQAEELLRDSNRMIEKTIKDIRESQAEKAETKKIREELEAFKAGVKDIDTAENDEMIARKMRQIQERKARREKRKRDKANEKLTINNEKLAGQAGSSPSALPPALKEGDTVRIKGLTTVGRIESIDGKMATVIFGDMRTKMRTERLEHADMPKREEPKAYAAVGRDTREAIDKRKLNFKQDIDVRGMRGDEAITAVTYFIDDAVLVGMSRVRILHGTGSGILRQLIRQYLSTVPTVKSYRDEHVQFGGAGITVVDLE